jgi:hypothetical protein
VSSPTFDLPFQALQLVVPEPVQERAHVVEPLGPGPVVAAGAFAPLADEARALQDAQVLRDRGPGDGQLGRDLARGTLLRPDEREDPAAAGIGKGSKRFFPPGILSDL